MSYQNKTEYRIGYKILPTAGYKIRKNCAGCGSKQIFVSTENFRINANGNLLDVWLIYQCERCKHTLNIPIYERVQAHKLSKEEYQAFLENNRKLAHQYERDKAIFSRNHLEIAWDLLEYTLIPMKTETFDVQKDFINVFLQNPFKIPVREDKLLAEILSLSRSQIKRLLKEERITITIV